ncbi:MAG: FeoB-associated Cys-rich membrane protein [Kiritimatiellae bacterium]|nr:FeoB-associated Cys-rich membrane protein [Kiritimatiellia bacterium]
MNYESIIVVSVVLTLATLAAWRVAKKGVPCECGGSCKSCGGKCCCCEHDESAEK